MSQFEKQYVVDFYNQNAEHFSSTRYNSWPSVTKFVNNLKSNTSILDAGCGNGKNMTIRNDLQWTGCDISSGLLTICKDKGFDNVLECDVRNLPFDNDTFDNLISIAVVHHISDFQERVKACQEFIRVVKPGGKIFIQVWQNKFVSNNKFVPINGIGDDGEYFVTWSKNQKICNLDHNNDPRKDKKNNVKKRYYHMFDDKEIDKLIDNLNDIIVEKKFIEANNWVVVLIKQ